MKRKIYTGLLLILSASLGLNSCTNGNNIITPIFPSETRKLISPSSELNTGQPQPSKTQTYDFLPTSSFTPTIAMTPTPTLAAEQQIDYFGEKFLNKPNCRLPCWWGVDPGRTSWKDTEALLIGSGIRPSSTKLPEGQVQQDGSFNWLLNNDQIENLIEFEESNGTVNKISVRSTSKVNSGQFLKFWINISPERIMKQYGKPSRIWLQSTSYGKDTVGYSLWLFFDQQGFLIITGSNTDRNEVYRICPSFEGSKKRPIQIEIILVASNNDKPLETLTGQYDGISKPYIMSIKDATKISVDEFYGQFLEQGTAFCFETPRSIWP